MNIIKALCILLLSCISSNMNGCPHGYDYFEMIAIGKLFDKKFEELEKKGFVEPDFQENYDAMQQFASTITCKCRNSYESNIGHCKERVEQTRLKISQGLLPKKDEERGHFA